MSVYLLVVVGATASIADAAQSCSGWPACSPGASEPAAMVAMGHRLTAALVGLIVLGAVAVTLRSGASRRIKTTAGVALGLYPVQIGVGALLASSGGMGAIPGLHLLVGVAIFGALLVALAWQLEAETGSSDESTLDPEALEPPAPDPEDADAPAPGSAFADRPLGARLRAKAFAYFRLTKPRLMWLLCLVAAAAMALAGGTGLEVRAIVFTLGGGVLAIGASGTFNHVLERDRDKRMSRTSDRPVATHQIPLRNAVAFGVALAVLSIAVFLQVNTLAAALGFVAILFYSVIYTLVLKPNTVQNTVIGGAAGALPALIGWAAVTGRIDVAGLALAGLIFVWTPAHFYNLALAYREDYERGGFPMMPVVRGETTTRKHILLWLGTTLSVASALIWLTNLGWLTAATTTVLGAVFLWAVIRLHREQTESAALRAFHASNAYLGLVLIAIVVDSLAF
ncbi:protoheme IX farnesyltransferase [Halobacteriales archaeon SW_7_65_23]|nr:MAG: protoheme IX farnesyltransferase [Halobacteriales archaeon SW_7_65_23]